MEYQGFRDLSIPELDVFIDEKSSMVYSPIMSNLEIQIQKS